MIINKAWYVEEEENSFILELINGRCGIIDIVPFRTITDDDIKPYRPSRDQRRIPVPDYLYRKYGLKKNDEALTAPVHIKFMPSEKEKLDKLADTTGMNLSDYLRYHIRQRLLQDKKSGLSGSE